MPGGGSSVWEIRDNAGNVLFRCRNSIPVKPVAGETVFYPDANGKKISGTVASVSYQIERGRGTSGTNEMQDAFVLLIINLA